MADEEDASKNSEIFLPGVDDEEDSINDNIYNIKDIGSDERHFGKNGEEEEEEDNGSNGDEAGDNEEVLALAASLAPQVEELEALLASPKGVDITSNENSSLNNTSKRDHDDDDDSMDNEWSGLASSEQLLRQELEFANSVGSMFGTPMKGIVPEGRSVPESPLLPPSSVSIPRTLEENEDDREEDSKRAEDSNDNIMKTPTQQRQRNRQEPGEYTLSDHAKNLGLQVEARGGWYTYPPILEELDVELNCYAREYILPVPPSDLKRLYVGLAEYQSPKKVVGEGTAAANSITSTHDKSLLDNSIFGEDETLPVRTVAIRIRPDILCGAVMDAVNHAMENLSAEVTKRQGGHLRGLVGGCVAGLQQQTQEVNHHRGETSSWWGGSANEAVSGGDLPPFLVDVQILTYKGNTTGDNLCERTLLIRTYPIPMMKGIPLREEIMLPQKTAPLETIDPSCHNRFREASSLVQQIESEGKDASIHTPATQASAASSSRWSALNFLVGSPTPSGLPNASQYSHNGDDQPLIEAVSTHLAQNYRPCPSVKAATGAGLLTTLPALSPADWPVVQSSYRFIRECWNELDTRDLTYASLRQTEFGAFPALPTLDVHYCSQIRRISREAMVTALLRSASELEQFARESEYSCANLSHALKANFDLYQIKPPALPRPVPLTAYPLDFTPPQATCPPWGQKVHEVLNLIAANTSDGNYFLGGRPDGKNSFKEAEDAVQRVFQAFQLQDDDEQAARLGRKNVQVMDRLAKMQAHKRHSILAIRNSYGRSPQAMKAGDDFHTKALQTTNGEMLNAYVSSVDSSPDKQVPLFSCRISVGGTTTGTCWVTATHVLFSTRLIPMVTGNRNALFDLREVEFSLQDNKARTPSSAAQSLLSTMSPMLKGSSDCVSVRKKSDGSEVYAFHPSLGANRWKNLVSVVAEIAVEDPETLKFSDRGGLLYMYESPPETTKPVRTIQEKKQKDTDDKGSV